MTENVERTEVIDLMSETREITEVINEIQGGTKQIHGAVGREAKVMNHLRRKTEGRVMRGLAETEEETEVAELKTEMIENMLKIVVTMTKLIGTGVSGMRKREGRRTGRKEKKQKSSRRGEGRRKED